MNIGQSIKLKAYCDKEIVRRVIELDKDVVIVCTEEEYRRALSEKRKPITVGFNLRYVVEG